LKDIVWVEVSILRSPVTAELPHPAQSLGIGAPLLAS
jgi:hypothetical protein